FCEPGRARECDRQQRLWFRSGLRDATSGPQHRLGQALVPRRRRPACLQAVGRRLSYKFLHAPMELRQLDYFAAIARHGGVRHAADELDVSPGNLSGQIKALEHELGVRLFERGSRGLKLTEAGAAFLERVDQVLLLLRT